ncbi:MAG TPA: bifunctional phosphopantothenoylcysteine decarboxylase/phosphopantothenate--cysteine ligase CoaBC [Bacilli bacterium]
MLKGKTVVLGVCGGIAAYKSVSLCSKLVQAGAEVYVIMTEAAKQFVTPLTFQTISRHSVATDTFEERDPAKVAHIALADAADLVVVAPATANMIAKMAYGLADDMLSTTLLATLAPVVAAPAMNVHMLAHPAVIDNIKILKQRGVTFIEPGEGQLACGYVGKGRLAEPEDMFAQIQDMLLSRRPLQGRKLMVTAGGTIERIDPVRYISNDSSGRMGFAIAEEARRMGAEVTLIYGNVHLALPQGITSIPVVSAEDMYQAVMKQFPEMDIIIKAAAVADYRPVTTSLSKMKKTSDSISLHLEKTTDILQALGERKTTQFIVGFAAETDDVEKNANDKLNRKKCDLLVANDVTLDGAGFGLDTNIVKIFDKNGLLESLPMMSKQAVARHLLELVVDRLPEAPGGAR